MTTHRIPFNAEDEAKIASAGNWAIIIAVTALISTGLTFITQIIQFFMVKNVSEAGGVTAGVSLIFQLIPTAIGILLAVWLLQAGKAFRKVALTDEADEHYLLQGFDKLRNYFRLIGILIIVGLCLFSIGMCSAMTCGAMLG